MRFFGIKHSGLVCFRKTICIRHIKHTILLCSREKQRLHNTRQPPSNLKAPLKCPEIPLKRLKILIAYKSTKHTKRQP